MALGQPQSMADAFVVSEVPQPSPRSKTVTSRQLRLPVPSCPSKMNTHPWTLQKAWLTFSLLQGEGEAFREGNQQALSTDRKFVQGYCGSADSLPASSLCSRPGGEHKLAADPFAEGPVGTAGTHPSSQDGAYSSLQFITYFVSD